MEAGVTFTWMKPLDGLWDKQPSATRYANSGQILADSA